MKPSTLRPLSQESRIKQITEELNEYNKGKAFWTEAIELAEKLKPELDRPLWKHIKEKMDTLVKEVDQRQDNVTDLGKPYPDRVVFADLGVKKAAVTVLQIETLVESIDKIEDTIDKIDQEIHKRVHERDNLSGSGTGKKGK